MSTESKHTPTLPVLRARAWSCHAASTIVGDVDGKQVVFADVAGNGRYGEEDAVIAAELVRRCNGYADLQSQNERLAAALLAFGHHKEALNGERCNSARPISSPNGPTPKCDCGLDAAAAVARAALAKVQP